MRETEPSVVISVVTVHLGCLVVVRRIWPNHDIVSAHALNSLPSFSCAAERYLAPPCFCIHHSPFPPFSSRYGQSFCQNWKQSVPEVQTGTFLVL
jgi:hypothetical protein